MQARIFPLPQRDKYRAGACEALIAEIAPWQRERKSSGTYIKWNPTNRATRRNLSRARPDVP
jgi:hypothetical protein